MRGLVNAYRWLKALLKGIFGTMFEFKDVADALENLWDVSFTQNVELYRRTTKAALPKVLAVTVDRHSKLNYDRPALAKYYGRTYEAVKELRADMMP